MQIDAHTIWFQHQPPSMLLKCGLLYVNTEQLQLKSHDKLYYYVLQVKENITHIVISNAFYIVYTYAYLYRCSLYSVPFDSAFHIICVESSIDFSKVSFSLCLIARKCLLYGIFINERNREK